MIEVLMSEFNEDELRPIMKDNIVPAAPETEEPIEVSDEADDDHIGSSPDDDTNESDEEEDTESPTES